MIYARNISRWRASGSSARLLNFMSSAVLSVCRMISAAVATSVMSFLEFKPLTSYPRQRRIGCQYGCLKANGFIRDRRLINYFFFFSRASRSAKGL